MFEKEFLTKVAESIVAKEEERAHLEETGIPMVHFDFDIIRVETAVFTAGRGGDYFKFAFEYELNYLDEAHLREKGNEIRIFRRSVRLSPAGNIVAIGDRVELLD